MPQIVVSYLDESFDRGKRGVFVVGGIVGRGVPIFELDRNWEKLRKRTDIGIHYFKASECQSGTGQFAKFIADPKSITSSERARLDSISHEFLNLIVHPVRFDNKSYLYIHGVGVVQEDFYDVIRDSRARAILGKSPYRLAYDFAMMQCAWAMKELEKSIKTKKLMMMDSSSSKDPVCFVCDENEEHSGLAHEAYLRLKGTNPVAADYMASFSFEDDKKCEPLQAADAAVYEVRRALKFSLGQPKGELRRQFNLLSDARLVFLITYCSKEQLLHIVREHNPGEPFKLDALMELQIDGNIRIGI
jgi:hypothetical protein